MPPFRVGDRVSVKETTETDLASGTGTIIDISYVSSGLERDEPMIDPRVYVLQLEDGSVPRFNGPEIEPD